LQLFRETEVSGEPFRNRVLRLILATILVGACWLLLLPAVGRVPFVAARMQWLEEQKIDPSAMYYTELESFEPVLERLNRKQRAR